MIKLKANKNNKIQFDIDIQSSEGEGGIDGRFRLMHEGVEYGFPVHILGNGNKAEVEIPALNKLLPNLTESTLDAKLEFIDGCDYTKAWEDKVEIDMPRLSIKTEAVKVSEEDPGDGSIKATVIVEKTKTEGRKSGEKTPRPPKISTGPFAVSDDAFEAVKSSRRIDKGYVDLYEAAKAKKYKTSTDDGHWHKAEADDEGDGKTLQTFSVGVKKPNPHTHKIVGTEVQKEKGHTHSII